LEELIFLDMMDVTVTQETEKFKRVDKIIEISINPLKGCMG
jgi:hypothetical protein